MPVPSTINDLATTAIANFPQGTESAKGTIDEYFRKHAEFLAYLRDNGGNYVQEETGAVSRPIQSKLRDDPALTDFSTIVADGTDQTAAVVAWLGTLDPAYDGLLKVPYGVKFNADTVFAALPVRAILVDDAATNSWNTAGSRARVITLGAEKGDPTSIVDLTTVVASSGHNASAGLDNRGTAGSASGNALVAAFHWFAGRLAKGQPGMRQIARWEWAKLSGLDKWSWKLIKFVPWTARNWEIWYASTAYAANATILTSGRTYSTVAGGTSGAVAPSHTTGTAVDGTITWTYLQTSQDSSLFTVDENGSIAANTTPIDGNVAYLKAGTDTVGSAIHLIEATGVSKRAEYRLRATNGAGAVLTAVPSWTAEADSTIRLRTSTLTDLAVTSNAGGLRLGVHGHTETTATNLDTTPTVANCGCLILSNTGATLITTFDDAVPTQEVTLFFTNANTTLVHSAGLVLKGAVNATPAANTMITIKKYSGSGSWFEKSRSF